MPIRNDAHLDEFHRDQQWHKPVRVATTANITISTALNNGDTLDGVTLATGDRVLVKDQSSGLQNGIYVVGASPARAYDMLVGIQTRGAFVYVIDGTTNGGTLWKNTNLTLPTIDTDDLTWEEFSGASGGDTIVLGSLSAGGSPVTISSGTDSRAFPGIAWLDGTGDHTIGSTALLVYRHGTTHLTGGKIVGRIGTVTAEWTFSWGSEFDIEDVANDLRCEDSVAVYDDTIYVWAREYDGSDNISPHLLVCDDPASTFTSGSTWTRHDLTMSQGSVQNYSQGHIVKISDTSWLLPVGWQSGGTHSVGVALVSDPTVLTSPTFVTVGSGANDYSEVGVERMPDGTLRAHLRADVPDDHYKSASTDDGVTWSAAASAFDASGYPMFRHLLSGFLLTVYRQAPNGDTYWRYSADDDATWSSETLLDSTGARSSYATLLQLDESNILCIYSVEATGTGDPTDSDIYSQVFTDSSDFGAGHVRVSAGDHTADFLRSKLVAGSGIQFETLAAGGYEQLEVSTTGQLGDHDHSADTTEGGDTLTPAVLNIPATNSPAQTANGQAVWDSDDDVLTVGTGAARRTIGYVGSTTPLIESASGSAGTSNETSRADHVHPVGPGIGEILISDTPSTPLIFADLIQNEAQDDLVYADP